MDMTDMQEGNGEDAEHNKSSSSGEKIIVPSGRGRGRGGRGSRGMTGGGRGGGAIMTKQDAAKALMSMPGMIPLGPYMVSLLVKQHNIT
jgi:hypothetical protein